jgi:hypothetical protein
MSVKLKFNRTWSVPQDEVADDIVIAAVPARSSFDDMLETCQPFGTGRIRAMPPSTARELPPCGGSGRGDKPVGSEIQR